MKWLYILLIVIMGYYTFFDSNSYDMQSTETQPLEYIYVGEVQPTDKIVVYTEKPSNYRPNIIGANNQEREYINNILNNTNRNVVNMINRIYVYDGDYINRICGMDALGCADSLGEINIINLNYYRKSFEAYISCGSFANTLNHEIGHIKGFSIGDDSEVYADNYAYDHTVVNLVYEDEPEC